MKLFGDQLPKWGGWKANLQWGDTDISHHSLCQVHGPLFEKRTDFLDVCTISLGWRPPFESSEGHQAQPTA